MSGLDSVRPAVLEKAIVTFVTYKGIPMCYTGCKKRGEQPTGFFPGEIMRMNTTGLLEAQTTRPK
jgi:hypothetical protein